MAWHLQKFRRVSGHVMLNQFSSLILILRRDKGFNKSPFFWRGCDYFLLKIKFHYSIHKEWYYSKLLDAGWLCRIHLWRNNCIIVVYKVNIHKWIFVHYSAYQVKNDVFVFHYWFKSCSNTRDGRSFLWKVYRSSVFEQDLNQ